MFCRCEVELLRRAEHAHVPGVPRASRRAAGREPAGGRVDGQARPRARLRDRGRGGLRAQELLLSRQPEGLPDLPVRPAARASAARCSSRARTATARSASCARTSRRTRRRRFTSAARTGRKVGAAHSLIDFNRGGTPLVEIVTEPDIRSADEARALPPAPPADDRRARDLRCRDGEGHAARRRERLGPRRRGGGLPHALGAEEHELVQRSSARGIERRLRAADRALRVGRRGRAAHLRLRAATPTR